MGIFKGFIDFMKDISTPKPKQQYVPPKLYDKTELAQALFDTLSLSLNKKTNPQIREIAQQMARQCGTRQKILLTVIELCGDPVTTQQLCLVSEAYVSLGAKYRQQAIKYLTKYIENGGHYHDNHIPLEISFTYVNLGKAYEGEYMFDKAEECYKKALATYYDTVPLCHLSGIYVKMNDIDRGLKVLYDAAKSPAMVTDGIFNECINAHIADLEDKKARGYVYKPRKKHNNSVQ